MKHYKAPIYRRGEARASSRWDRVLAGIVSGSAVWMMVSLLGVPHIFGISSEAGLIPFAIAGGILGVTKLHMVHLYFATLLLMFVVFVGFTGIFDGLARGLVRRDATPVRADAVVALSAGVTADGYLTQQGLDRYLTAVSFIKAGVAPTLVVTREERKTGGDKYSTAADQAQLAQLAGVSNMISTAGVRSTRDEAVQLTKLAKSRGWTRVVIVTSPFHSKRACATFERAGAVVSCVPSQSRDIAIRRLRYPHDRIQAFAMLIYETAGTLEYRRRGWL